MVQKEQICGMMMESITETPDYLVTFRDPVPNNITCLAGGEEMLRVGPDGFWVRGVKVEQDAQEAQAVYNAFKQWMAWASLEGRY